MSYPGGKGGPGVAQAIINQQPPHSAYLELCLGSGAVLRSKRPADLNIGVDLDLSPFLEHDEGDIPNLQLYEDDILDFLTVWEFRHDELLYLDPPYLLDSRRSQRSIYKYEMTDWQHRILLDMILNLPCMVQISSYENELYASALKDWRLVTFTTTNRQGDPAVEHLWMNYPEPVMLHDIRYLGNDFRERERIKRKRQRWLARLETLDPLERYAMLSAIGEAFEVELHPRQK